MNWFYNLKKPIRITIAILTWVPVLVFSYLIGDSTGENGENMQTWQALLFLLLLAIPIFFDVLAGIAQSRETKAEKEKAAALEAEQNAYWAQKAAEITLVPDEEIDARLAYLNTEIKEVQNDIAKLAKNDPRKNDRIQYSLVLKKEQAMLQNRKNRIAFESQPVYFVNGGRVFHIDKACVYGKNYETMTLAQAMERDIPPCKHCAKHIN